MKFKVGDKVVRISTDSTARITSKMFDVGDSFIIRDITSGPTCWDWGPGEFPQRHGVIEEELELESVYNSKLYKALK